MPRIDHIVFDIDDDRWHTTDPSDFASERRLDRIFARPSPCTVARDRFRCGELPGFNHGCALCGFLGPPLGTAAEESSDKSGNRSNSGADGRSYSRRDHGADRSTCQCAAGQALDCTPSSEGIHREHLTCQCATGNQGTACSTLSEACKASYSAAPWTRDDLLELRTAATTAAE